MIYIKSIGVGLAFVLGFICATLLLGALVLGIEVRLQSQQEATFYILLHFPYF